MNGRTPKIERAAYLQAYEEITRTIERLTRRAEALRASADGADSVRVIQVRAYKVRAHLVGAHQRLIQTTKGREKK